MEKFDPDKHTLEYMEREWEISPDTLLYKRMHDEVGLRGEQLAGALWAAKETCAHCDNYNSGCQCWNDE